MPAPPPVRATRRRVLAVTAATGPAVFLGAGCEVVTGSPGPGASSPADTSGTPAATAEAEEDRDEQLVARVSEDVARALAVVTAAGRGRRAVRRTLREVARTHRAHLDELPTPPSRSRRVRVGGDDRAALRQVRAVEQRLQRRLAEAAVDAESGPLAALLSSMSAAVAQRLASGVLT